MYRKLNNKYNLSVEGETEKWYFEWLQSEINKTVSATATVSFKSLKIEKNPIKYVKGLIGIGKLEAVHICDKESNEPNHTVQFLNTLKALKESQKQGKIVKYDLGYSNYTFDLWIILHKIECKCFFTDRNRYIEKINSAYNERFQNMNEYKHEANFKRILRCLSLADVKAAIVRAKSIRTHNLTNCTKQSKYGYDYFESNPDLSIHIFVEKVLEDAGI
ncbi:MAG TPA: RloB domain-containing protein [Candidatus Avacidaminococcus intestinavium]|uniref:RloB domain-containing protein n=1 Tax=Candidatus Avacidaminococcus intestinavium TaxID=2840684 RepID=A0A9D1MP22_9FIRM|nr:RloB domain-containing protein [Candidatus Avacidaminococcus intestinavium]